MSLRFSKKSLIPLTLTVLGLIPSYGKTQSIFPPAPSGQRVDIINNILVPLLNMVWILTVTAVIILFILAGFKFINAKGKPEELETARRFLIWAVLGIIVILFAFSILTIIRTTLGLS